MRRERGTTLLVVLVMLVVITLLGIAGIRMSSSSLLIVGNLQARKFVENYGQQTVEQMMSAASYYNSPQTGPTLSLPSGLTVAVGDRVCLYSAPASGYSAVAAITPEDNTWEFFVRVTDSFTGAKTNMVQGVKIRQLSGSCSAVATTASHCWKTTGSTATRYTAASCPE